MTRDTEPHEMKPSDPPASERDTGPIREAADVRLYLELDSMRARLDALVAHLAGRIEGHDVELAQSNAFEKRISGAVQYISSQNDRQQETLDTIKGLCEKMANGLFEQEQRVVVLERWRNEHTRRENHCDNCEFKRSSEALGG